MPNASIHRNLPARRSILSTGLFAFTLLGLIAIGSAWGAGWIDPHRVRLHFSEPYRLACALAQKDPEVSEAIGNVRQIGWLPQGRLQRNGDQGSCELQLPITGERAAGQLEARLEMREGRWFWVWVNLRMPNGDLLVVAPES